MCRPLRIQYPNVGLRDVHKKLSNLTLYSPVIGAMPRLARLDAAGVLHHIMIRGIERRKIFRDNKDRDEFIERLSVVLPATNTSCYAWSFMWGGGRP